MIRSCTFRYTFSQYYKPYYRHPIINQIKAVIKVRKCRSSYIDVFSVNDIKIHMSERFRILEFRLLKKGQRAKNLKENNMYIVQG